MIKHKKKLQEMATKATCKMYDDNARAMTQDELSHAIGRARSAAMGLAVAGIGCFIGLAGGLSFSLGAGSAIAIGIGASTGLFVASFRNFRKAKQMALVSQENGLSETV